MLQTDRIRRGKQNYLAGMSAEQSVRKTYEANGYVLAAERWRGGGGELDLVFQRDSTFVFVEVKKSRTHDLAASRVSQQQIDRIFAAATVFISDVAKVPFADMRFDVALVNGSGVVQILENALIAT
ncbi:MAG: YraN family protein [Cognatishimia sp.]|uniref:YraN family protein n=1 Tax=Cognatishimia sp. TaxID=2211648 RepID=UPI003B8CE6EF